MKCLAIQVPVTKDIGKAGGFNEKIRTAEDQDCTVVIIRRAVEIDRSSYDNIGDIIECLNTLLR